MRTIYVDKIIPKMLLVKGLRSAWPGVVWSPLSPARVANLEETALPGDRWLRVQNRVCGICATDLSLLNVAVDPSVAPAALPGNNHFYLGHEVISDVVEVGPGVSQFSVGDRVIMDTRFAGPNCRSQEIDPVCDACARGDFSLCVHMSAGRGLRGAGGGWGDGYTAHESEVYPCPDDISDDQAALVEPMAVALHAVLRRPPGMYDRVLVIGAGIIGLLTVQAVRAVSPDSKITVMAKYPHQVDMARQCGADDILDPSAGYAEVARRFEIEHFTSPLNKGMLLGGFDVIYDCVGKAGTIEDGLRWTRAGGAVVIVGLNQTPMKLDLSPVWYQEVDLVGSINHGRDTWFGEQRHTYDWVIQLLREGKLRADGLITHRFKFDDYHKAIDVAASKARSGSIKVVFDYT